MTILKKKRSNKRSNTIFLVKITIENFKETKS
jgi:hypothetical protein